MSNVHQHTGRAEGSAQSHCSVYLTKSVEAARWNILLEDKDNSKKNKFTVFAKVTLVTVRKSNKLCNSVEGKYYGISKGQVFVASSS